MPTKNVTSTKANHPKIAFLRCWPLQRAIRAARLCAGGGGREAPPVSEVSGRSGSGSRWLMRFFIATPLGCGDPSNLPGMKGGVSARLLLRPPWIHIQDSSARRRTSRAKVSRSHVRRRLRWGSTDRCKRRRAAAKPHSAPLRREDHSVAELNDEFRARSRSLGLNPDSNTGNFWPAGGEASGRSRSVAGRRRLLGACDLRRHPGLAHLRGSDRRRWHGGHERLPTVPTGVAVFRAVTAIRPRPRPRRSRRPERVEFRGAECPHAPPAPDAANAIVPSYRAG